MKDQSGVRARMAIEARRIAAQHRKLRQLQARVVESLAMGQPADDRRGAFQRFHDALESHFSLEEDLYFPALHGLRPELEDRLIALKNEHETLRQDLSELRPVFAGSDTNRCRRCLDEFVVSMSNHESREETLIAPFVPSSSVSGTRSSS